jgi:L-ascorbate metabolism protein UlaG (beta-lactamase superfamily)
MITVFGVSVIAFIIFLAVFVFLQQPMFGKRPGGERLLKIRQSPNYRNGAFQNLSRTPNLTEGVSYYSVMKEFFFSKKERVKPVDTLPSMKTDLFRLAPDMDVLVWFGHSSYFMQIDGKRILVDPVLSGSASPISFTTMAFKGTDRYTTDDIPEIDYLFISHDHWDHLDYETITKLRTRIKKVICGLGTGEHLEYWGFKREIILEKDWNETILLDPGFIVHTTSARHFSGRGLSRNKSLWTSFVLQTPTMKLFLGGDSGYDTHFAEIGNTFGPFDLAILENGQYDKSWKYIHMMPDEVLKAGGDLRARRIFPVHSAKFALGNHAWDEPLKQITRLNKKANHVLITPMIGEEVDLKGEQSFSEWWNQEGRDHHFLS